MNESIIEVTEFRSIFEKELNLAKVEARWAKFKTPGELKFFFLATFFPPRTVETSLPLLKMPKNALLFRLGLIFLTPPNERKNASF